MEFIAPDPQALVRSENVKATLDAFQLVPSAGRLLLEKHQLVLADEYVLVQRWLDALKELGAVRGAQMLRRVGAAIVEKAIFPPSLSTVEAVLVSLDKIYYMNHRGDVGHYFVKVANNGIINVRCETPYPRMFEWGLIEGICRNRGGVGGSHAVGFHDGPAGSPVTCEIEVVPAAAQQATAGQRR